MSRKRSPGFTLIEMAVVMVILGITMAIGVPSFVKYRRSQELRSAAQNIAGQIRLARANAMVTGKTQRFHLYDNFSGYDYHVHDGNGGIKSGWILPAGVGYSWGGALVAVDLSPDGRASTSLDIQLVRDDGVRDTVSVDISGMVRVH